MKIFSRSVSKYKYAFRKRPGSLSLIAATVSSLAAMPLAAAPLLPGGNTPSLKTDLAFPSLQKPIVYSAKFVCGPQTKPATSTGQATTFAALQPGNYATALNILPLGGGLPEIEVFASMHGSAGNPSVTRVTVTQAFETHTLACEEIINAFGVTARDEAYEGFLYITRSRADLDVQAVYTYASRDSFQFKEFRGVDELGNVVVEPETGIFSIGGAGGGGLGLGASIDVERVVPINRGFFQ